MLLWCRPTLATQEPGLTLPSDSDLAAGLVAWVHPSAQPVLGQSVYRWPWEICALGWWWTEGEAGTEPLECWAVLFWEPSPTSLHEALRGWLCSWLRTGMWGQEMQIPHLC